MPLSRRKPARPVAILAVDIECVAVFLSLHKLLNAAVFLILSHLRIGTIILCSGPQNCLIHSVGGCYIPHIRCCFIRIFWWPHRGCRWRIAAEQVPCQGPKTRKDAFQEIADKGKNRAKNRRQVKPLRGRRCLRWCVRRCLWSFGSLSHGFTVTELYDSFVTRQVKYYRLCPCAGRCAAGVAGATGSNSGSGR